MALLDDPRVLVEAQPPCCIEINQSTNPLIPKAMFAWMVFQKRWTSRYWQSHGIRIFVDLNVDPKFDEMNLLGVPQGFSSFATRAYKRHATDILRQFGIAKRISGKDTPIFVVYGGGKYTQRICNDNGLLWIPENSDRARGRY